MDQEGESADENYMDVVAEDCLQPFSINIDEVPLPEAQPIATEDPKRKITVDRSRLRTHASKDNDKKNMRNEADSTSDKKSGDSRRGKRGVRRSSLSSISSVSSSSLSRSPSPARTRSKSKTPDSSPSPPVLSKFRDRKPHNRSGSYSYNNGGNRYRNKSRSRSPRYNRRRSRSRSNSRNRYRGSAYKRRSPVPQDRSSIRSSHNSLQAEYAKWEKFRTESDKMERELTKTLRFHEKNPEKHPMYPEEWKKFWNVRYKELQAEGKDPSTHDFKPEWIKFWDKRMKEMHEEDFKEKKEQLGLKLALPKEQPQVRHNKYSSRSRGQDGEDDVIVISPGPGTSGDTYPKRSWRNKPDSRDRKRSLSPWDKDDVPSKMNRKATWANTHYPDKGRDRTVKFPGQPRPPYLEEVHSDPEPEGGARVVTVVRLLTALESQLGSFGPAVNQLLASALTMEKKRPGSSESMLANPDNLVFFETVKEKLKGQLFAGIVEHGLVMATKASIQNLADMLFRADKMGVPEKVSKPVIAQPVRAEPVSVPGIGAMDKSAIASQIAAALVAEGKADVTHEELESLINAVVGMAKASATLEKPITTAAFVSQMQTVEPTTPVVTAVVTPPKQETSSLEKLLSVVHSKPTVAAAKAEPAKPVFEETFRPKSTCLFPCTLVNEEVEERERTPTPPPKVNKVSMNIEDMNMEEMEELTEADLKALLQNFKDLSTKEQYCLITYLKKIEATEPDRVENLRQFVNLPPSQPASEAELSRPLSPFSLRLGRSNPTLDDNSTKYRPEPDVSDEKIRLDDSDDDYSFEDIYEAASKKVNEKEKAARELEKQTDVALKSFTYDAAPNKVEVEATSTASLAPKEIAVATIESGNFMRETDILIANLMGNLPEKFGKKNTPSPSTVKPTTPVSEDLPAKANLGLNIDISNTLVDGDKKLNPSAAMKSVGAINVITPNNEPHISPVPNDVPYEEPLPLNNNTYDPNIPTGIDFNDPYSQQAFHNNQYPASQAHFPNGQGYPQEFPQGVYAHQQQFPQQGYQGNYAGNYYGGGQPQPPTQFPPQQFPPQQHMQQQGNPQHYGGNPQQFGGSYPQQQMGRGGYPQGYQQQQPGQPPFRPNGPPHEYANQFGGQGYNHYPPQQQGFF